MKVQQSASNKTVGVFTVHENPPMPDQSVDNFESLSCGCPDLVQREPIQSLERRLDLILSSKLLHKFLCAALGQVSYQRGRTH
jgi:hypothetical protein